MIGFFYRYLPVLIFCFIWSLVLILYYQQYFNIYVATSNTLIILYSSLFSFVLSYILFVVYDTKPPLPQKNTLEATINKNFLVVLILSLSALIAVGTSMVFYTIADLFGGLSVYVEQPLKVRYQIVEYQLNPLESPPIIYRLGNYLINIGFAGCIFGGVLFALRGWTRCIAILPFILLFFSSSATLGRYLFFNGAAFFIISYIISCYYLDDKLLKKRLFELVIYVLAFVVFFGLATYLIIESRAVSQVSNIQSFILETGYLYITGGISAFDNFIYEQHSLKYGQSSFRSIFSWLARFGLWPEEGLFLVHEQFTRVSPNFAINTYTLTKAFYEDFGILGVLTGGMILGAVSKIYMFKSINQFSVITIMINCILLFTLLMSFYSFYLYSITTLVFRVAVVVLIHYLLKDKLYLNTFKSV